MLEKLFTSQIGGCRVLDYLKMPKYVYIIIYVFVYNLQSRI